MLLPSSLAIVLPGALLRFASMTGRARHQHFSPTNPPIALQSFTRDVRLTQASTAAFCLHQGGGWSMRCDLRWMHDAVVVVAVSDGETQCLKVRSDEVLDGPSLRSQATTGSCGLSSAGAAATTQLLRPFWCARSASKRDQQPSSPPFVWSSRSSEQEDTVSVIPFR